MAFFPRSSFAKGWCPDCDAGSAPPDALLRADNLTLDEIGVAALRRGSAVLATFTAAVHSLYTEVLSLVRYRMTGSGDAVYANGSALETAMDGSGDVAFGGFQGQILFGRGTSRFKYDGTTTRNWGIPMTGGAPTIAAGAQDGKTFASGASTESPAFVVNEDNGSGATFTANHAGVSNGAIVVNTNTTTGRATLTRTFTTATDFTVYDGGTAGHDEDTFSLYVYIPDPQHFLSLGVVIDVNDGTFQTDLYYCEFQPSGHVGTAAGNVAMPFPLSVGWVQLTLTRQQFARIGSTSLKDWTTVKAIRVIVKVDSAAAIKLDTIRFVGGRLSGTDYEWAYALAYNTGTYVGLSALSPFSAQTTLLTQGAVVTVPADAARDSQANEIWLFRRGGTLEGTWRSAVQTGVSGTGAIPITDNLSDADTLTVDVPAELDNVRPPANIIGLEGPYFDRMFALTSDGFLWPSRRLNPDSFATGQAIRVAAADEQPFWVKDAFGGLYIGTTKDIYRLEGTGAELPDGSIDFTKRPLNVDHPPINVGLAQEGNLLVFLADDGWRSFTGEATAPITLATSLLYRGYTRHGISPVNLASGRFRAAIAKGQFVAMTPEGSATSSTPVLYRHVPTANAWYRDVYPADFTTIYRERGGTILAGDTDGRVWQLDTGTDDDGDPIPVTIWTKRDDHGLGFAQKEATDLHFVMDTGGAAVAVACYVDGADVATAGMTVTTSALDLSILDARAVGRFRQLQLRLTGLCTAFRFAHYGVTAVPRPLGVLVWDSGPIDLGRKEETWIRWVLVKLNGQADVAIEVWLDGVLKTTQTAAVRANADVILPVDFGRGIIGRQPRVRLTSSAPFLPYWLEVTYRGTGRATDKSSQRIPITVGAGATA